MLPKEKRQEDEVSQYQTFWQSVAGGLNQVYTSVYAVQRRLDVEASSASECEELKLELLKDMLLCVHSTMIGHPAERVGQVR